MIKKRILTTLTMMAVLVSLAAAPALAESQLDQSYELHNGSFGIGAAGLYEAVEVGTTGTLDKVELLLACCGGTGTPTRDLKATISSSGVSEVAWIPKEQFPEDNEQNFKWVTVTLDTPLPVQDTKGLKIHLTDPGYNDWGPQNSQYLWAATSSSTYSHGALYWCYMGGLHTNLNLYCEPIEPTSDADFRTYVTPGPDLAPPITKLPPDDGSISNPNGPRQGSTTNSTSASFTFSADEAGSTFECKMDDNAWQSCASPKGYTGLSDGSHTFQVRAVDPSGNADPTPESRQWFVDTTPPDTIITSGPSSGTVTGRQVKFEFTSSESGSTFMCRWSEGVSGSGSWTSCSSPWSIGFLFGGPYTVEVYAIDHVGNADPQPASRTWTVDATAPAAPIINNPADNSFDTDSNVILSGTAEPDSTIEVFDGETSEGTTPPVDSSGAWSMTLTAVGEGDHTYTARATDTANNASASSNSITVNVDTTRPTVSGTRPLNRATNVGRGTNLTATFSEKMTRSTLNNTTFKLYKVNSDGSTTPVSSWSVSSTTDGLKATLDPFGAKTTLLARNTKYKGVVTTGTKDLAGNALVQQRSWTFTTKP